MLSFCLKQKVFSFPELGNLIYNSPSTSTWKTETQSDICSPLCWTVAPREARERQPCPPSMALLSVKVAAPPDRKTKHPL